MNKKIVTVNATFDEQGNITPHYIIFDDKKYVIDKVLDIKNCASFKVGGIGLRYTININGIITYVFLEENKWFVEQK